MQARAMLARTRDSLAADARMVVHSDVLLWRGLSHVARDEHRDLLVVGSGRDAPERRVKLGQHARGLLEHLECPLAIAPRGMHGPDEPRIERIGVGFDGHPEARVALELAEAIAAAAAAELEVRGVVDDRVAGGLRVEQITLEGGEIVADQTTWLLDRALQATRGSAANVRVDVTCGSPAEALRALGAEVDLLVIGSSRSGPAARVSVGSTGSALVDGAPCPVLLVPRLRDDPAL